MHVARYFKGPEEVLHARNLSVYDRMVYFEMAFQAWFSATCKISQSSIGKRLGISVRQVRKSQGKLEEERFITTVDAGLHKVTTYRLNSRVFVPKTRDVWGRKLQNEKPN
jgi:hypothetical protein